MFFDKTLSASGAMSCATCHDPDHAYGPPNDLAVQLGGPDGRDSAGRAPSRRCATRSTRPPTPTCSTTPTASARPGPAAASPGTAAPTRSPSRRKLPLLSPVEMANASPADVVAQDRGARRTPTAFRRRFRRWPATDADAAFEDGADARCEAFQREDASFHPYTSKFDLHAGNKIGGDFTPAELRGVQGVRRPRSAATAPPATTTARAWAAARACSPTTRTRRSAFRATPTLAGQPGPAATSISGCAVRCAPTTRPGAGDERVLRHVQDADAAQRRHAARSSSTTASCTRSSRRSASTHARHDARALVPDGGRPAEGHARPRRSRRYGLVTTAVRRAATVQKYDDLPARASRRTSTPQMPLDGRARGAKPPLGERDVADLICFLETLTDGYRPPATPPTTGRCVN